MSDHITIVEPKTGKLKIKAKRFHDLWFNVAYKYRGTKNDKNATVTIAQFLTASNFGIVSQLNLFNKKQLKTFQQMCLYTDSPKAAFAQRICNHILALPVRSKK